MAANNNRSPGFRAAYVPDAHAPSRLTTGSCACVTFTCCVRRFYFGGKLCVLISFSKRRRPHRGALRICMRQPCCRRRRRLRGTQLTRRGLLTPVLLAIRKTKFEIHSPRNGGESFSRNRFLLGKFEFQSFDFFFFQVYETMEKSIRRDDRIDDLCGLALGRISHLNPPLVN